MDKYIGRMVEFQGDCCTKSYFSEPVGENIRHGLLIVPEIWGINDHMKRAADSFARQGFAVIVPDIYTSGAVSGELSESEIQSVQELGTRFDHNRLAEAGYLESELSKLSEKKRKDIEKVMDIFKEGAIGHKLYPEILKTAGNFISRHFVDGDNIKFMIFSPSGEYPPSLSKEFQDIIDRENRHLTMLESELKKWNPIKPEQLDLLKRGKERLYCIRPFIHMDISERGIRSCSWLGRIDGFNTFPVNEEAGIVKAWESDSFERVREAVRDGTYRHCKLSFCAEVRGVRENLLTMGELRERYPAIADYMEGKDRRYRKMLDYVSISVDSVCNLSCPSCSLHMMPRIPRKIKSELIDSLKSLGRNLKVIFLAGMGEVFFSPVYLDWIMNFRKEDYPALERIHIISNGLKLTPELWSRLPVDFTGFIHTIIVSIDGATKETYEENRRGGNFDVLLKNLDFIKTLRERGNIKYLRTFFVYQANNYSEMPEMVDFAKRHSFDEVFFEKLMNWGTYDESEYRRRDILNPEHPDHGSFEAVRDKILEYQRKSAVPKITFLT